jgi:hypothetical protein
MFPFDFVTRTFVSRRRKFMSSPLKMDRRDYEPRSGRAGLRRKNLLRSFRSASLNSPTLWPAALGYSLRRPLGCWVLCGKSHERRLCRQRAWVQSRCWLAGHNCDDRPARKQLAFEATSKGVGWGRSQEINPMQSKLSMHLSPRCGAPTRRGSSCRSPAMRNGRCRMHGGMSPGAPKGNKSALKRAGVENLHRAISGVSA